jgi:anti-anti-sigma regulatory factor
MRAAGGDLRLRTPQGTAKRIIEITGLDKVLIVEP